MTCSAVRSEAELTDLMADVTVTQTYRNPHETPIEAVYTFALPVDGVLLDVEAVLGERELTGAVVEKAVAEVVRQQALSVPLTEVADAVDSRGESCYPLRMG